MAALRAAFSFFQGQDDRSAKRSPKQSVLQIALTRQQYSCKECCESGGF
jgi:hypothetical protein